MASPGQPSQSPPSLTVSTLSSFKEKFPQLNVSLVPSSSTPVQPQPAAGVAPSTTSPPECQAANIATLAEMFPLMTEAALQRALSQCGGHLSSALDLLLTQDLVDSERHQQSLYTTRFRSICDLWVRGQCTGARAAACRDRHFYNDTDVSRRTCTGSGKKEKKLEGFSSPYRARVVREQVEVIKEQVNVDSGNYERWSEVQERELVDLTGNDAEEIIDLSSDDEKCDKLKESNSEVEMERGTENLAEDEPVECKGGMIARRKVPGVEKLAKRKLRFGSENKQSSEVLIESLIVQMESIKDIIEQTAVAIVNTEDLSLKRGKRSQNNKLEGNLKRVKIEMPKTNVDDVENTQGGRKVKKKTKRNKVAKSSDQQKTKDSVKSEQCMSRTNEDKKSNQKKKSKRNKGEMKNSKVGEKLDVPVKSEKCSKISKSNVKSENKPFSSERKRRKDMKQEKV